MLITPKNREFIQIEEWLQILINTYATHPSTGLAQVIHYYLIRLMNMDNMPTEIQHTCSYFSLLKFWIYRANKSK